MLIELQGLGCEIMTDGSDLKVVGLPKDFIVNAIVKHFLVCHFDISSETGKVIMTLYFSPNRVGEKRGEYVSEAFMRILENNL